MVNKKHVVNVRYVEIQVKSQILLSFQNYDNSVDLQLG